MELLSTSHNCPNVDLRTAVLKGLAEDGGLYIPPAINKLRDSFFAELPNLSIQEIALEVAGNLIGSEIAPEDLKNIIDNAVTFDAPLVEIGDGIHSLELFHGPTLAFKDFGARFMAQLVSHFVQQSSEELTILVATSGDTGSAVASGFFKAAGINVVILYPKGKVSPSQEKQLTTLGENITALEIDGAFDDCQSLVKQAFKDRELRERCNLTSANSINIARLIPQSFYYFRAAGQLPQDADRVFSVPSGNFGNLTAGLMAKRMGLRIDKFIAATNANDIVPRYLNTGKFEPRPSIATISNAMDVGSPNNFPRMLELYPEDSKPLTSDVVGYAYSDEETKETLKEVYEKYNYTLDPHGAVGYRALRTYLDSAAHNTGIVFETAHPAKFPETVTEVTGAKVEIPQRLQDIIDRPKSSIELKSDYSSFKEFLLSR